MNNLIWLLLLLGFATKIQADTPKTDIQLASNSTVASETKIEAKTAVIVERNAETPKVEESKTNSSQPTEDKVQKRGLIDLTYGYGDKYDHGYYVGQGQLDIPAATQLPPTYPTFPPDFFLTSTTTTAAPPPSPPTGPIDLGHTTHIHKIITFYQGIPEPYPVIKHVPVPVEKHVPVAVNVPVPVPVAVEKTIHVPVKVPVKVPVPIPQPYPVVKEVHVPVKVFVDKPYPVYVHEKYDYPQQHPQYHYGHQHHVHWKQPERPLEEVSYPENPSKPSEEVYGHSSEEWAEKPIEQHEHLEPPAWQYDKLHEDVPHFVTLEKPEYSDYEKYYSASNKVEKNHFSQNRVPQRAPHQSKPEEDRKHQQQYIARPASIVKNNGDKYSLRGQQNDQNQYKNYHRDPHDHRNHRDRDDRRDRNHRNQREHRQQQDRREGRQHTDELVLHTNF